MKGWGEYRRMVHRERASEWHEGSREGRGYAWGVGSSRGMEKGGSLAGWATGKGGQGECSGMRQVGKMKQVQGKVAGWGGVEHRDKRMG